MEKVAKVFLILLCAVVFPVVSYSQVTLTSGVSASIVSTIGLTKTFDLDFGNLAVNNTQGTCILLPVGGSNPTRNITGGVTLPSFYGTPRAAEFTVSGVPSEVFTITIPSNDLTISNGVTTMVVNAYTTDQTVVSPGTSWYGTFGPNGTTFHVGATVKVAANQQPGIYQDLTGFPVTVNYQ